ncbi:MAG: transglutaminase family protein [Rhodospirillaceae bacterium]
MSIVAPTPTAGTAGPSEPPQSPETKLDLSGYGRSTDPVVYDVKHETIYRYSMPVTVSHHSAHLRPRSFGTQEVLNNQLMATPLPEHRSERLDIFGNTFTSFSLSEPYETCRIISQSRVRITPPLVPRPATGPRWEEVAARIGMEVGADILDAVQFRHSSPLVTPLPEIRSYAQVSFLPRRPILDAVVDLTARIYRDFSYDPTATTISTPLAEVMRKRAGVCQDFAHLQIACLRSLGLAARYVSGYVLTSMPGSDETLEGGDASHAWLSVFIPDPNIPNGGWLDVDPTNNKIVTREHITVAWGRDFDDVSPIKGVMLGGGDQSIEVDVSVTPMPL